MARVEEVGFRETLKTNEVTPEQIASGFAVEKMKKIPAEKDAQGNVTREAYEEATGVYEHKGSVMYTFPGKDGAESYDEDDLAEAVAMWGVNTLLNKAIQMIRIDVGKVAKSGSTPEESQAFVDKFVPGVTRQRAVSGTSAKEKALIAAIMALPEDQRNKLLADAGITL